MKKFIKHEKPPLSARAKPSTTSEPFASAKVCRTKALVPLFYLNGTFTS